MAGRADGDFAVVAGSVTRSVVSAPDPVLFDTTPAFTTFLSATNGALPTNLTAVAISAPSPGGSGAIQWTFTGTLRPGGTGIVEFRVNVEQ